jgi:uncharacterized protein (TIGR03437 family)
VTKSTLRLVAGAILMAIYCAQAQVITTVAGTSFTFPSTPLLAPNAPLGYVKGVAVDASGNVYAADSDNNIIVRFVPGGQMTVVAGNGIGGFSGDEGPATSASLNSPVGVAVDLAGNLYIADGNNGRIRRVSNGTIRTVAGNGNAGFSGDGGPATSAALSSPSGVSLDLAGNLYVADQGNNRIRKVSNGTITTVAGNGNAGYSGDGGPATSAALNSPAGVAVDPTGNLYIADFDNYRIRKVSNGSITTFAGNGNFAVSGDGGPAIAAALSSPAGVALDSIGNVYIADLDNSLIRKVSGGTITTVAGTIGQRAFNGDGGPALSASLYLPFGVAVDSAGDLYIADTFNYRVRGVSNGTITTVAGNGDFRFSGDGGPATSAALNTITLAADSGGNLYITTALNNRIRQVSKGIITTIAGNGDAGFSGDGGPATSAMLNLPGGTAIDSVGNLYIADGFNGRVREVSGGRITTVAGNGGFGFSGDGGPATSATLYLPGDVAVDSFGNLYIADYDNQRIRKVSAGTITTVAGNGIAGFSGDGGPATSASLFRPVAVAVDSAGNLYIADQFNQRIRRMSGGTITTIAGNGNAGFSGDGGLAISASLDSPNEVAVDAGGNVFISDQANFRIREVLINNPTALLSPGQLQFTAASGGAPTAPQTLSLTSSADGLAFSVNVPSNATWLQVSPASGASPRLIQVIADPTGLAPNTYQTTMAVNTPNANPTSTTAEVTFTVTAAVPPTLWLDKQSLSFPYPAQGSARSQTITVSNTGGGSLQFTATTTTNAGGKWLSVSPTSAQVLPGSPVTVTVTANPAGLAPGAYSGQVNVTAGAQSQNVSVTMTISTLNQAILLSQSGLSFLAVQSGGVVPSQSFGVQNIGVGVVNWAASTSTLTGGNWLQVTPSGGSSDASAEITPRVTVSADASALSAGVYYGLVRVNAPGAANSPQVLTVFLQVLQPGSNVPPAVQPAQLVFAAPAGGESPGSQLIQVYNIVSQAKSFQSQVSADTGLSLIASPQDATLDPQQPTSIVVQPFTTDLSAGVYNGTMTLQFSDGTVSAVQVSVIVSNQGSTTSSSSGANIRPADSTSCTPSKLVPALNSLGQSFQVSAGWPAALIVSVKDDCGNPMPATGSVMVNFSNGDQALSLTAQGAGSWENTWQTTNATPTVTLTINAANQGLIGNAVVNGTLASQQQPPVFPSSGIVSAATAVAFTALAPGSAISIYGNMLAESAAAAQTLPLPSQLVNTDTQVFVSGTTAVGTSTGLQNVPLYYVSPNQVNALIPYEIATDTHLQLLVQRGSALSVPVPINTAQAQPAIFSATGEAGGVGVIQVYPAGGGTPYLASASTPAHVGDTIVAYCTGLGAVNPVVKDGAAPGGQLSSTTGTTQLMIGGQPALVSFSGLTPGFAGLYQVNAVVPSGTQTGTPVPVTLSIDGQTSRLVTLAIQ